MNPVEQDIERRKNEIVVEVIALFNANMKFTDWDVPEADNALAAKLIIETMQEALDGLKAKLDAGEFK
ncbi:hypothetical protein MN086_02505 [Sulfurovum sp. XGS-02]|uniref:hypothetical protein n=1 Tax=Sulfurovum sp. XGS-02 TaxID=2925411 RepID=UPI00205A38C8|nr:hypothetical protein [Sulfurovum sp. XGS-02]UPT78024.1 hypothetical protein MN086_02505 [Sulfurovum sp. XGS-02]